MPKSFYKIFFAVLFFIFSGESIAQKYLVFDKPGLVKRVRFYPNEELTFKTSKSGIYIRDKIVGFEGQTVLFQNTLEVNVDSIKFIKVGNVSTFSKVRSVVSGVLITSGVGYLIIDSFNNGINSKDVFDPKTLNASAIMILAGVIIKPWSNRRHKIGNNKRLYIIDMDEGLNQ